MKETDKLKENIKKFISRNGACNINIEEEEILLYNGGLFQDMNKDFATLWIGDLDDTIRYLRRLKIFLNKNKFNTRRDFSSLYIDRNRK
jgi:hypothetical protein